MACAQPVKFRHAILQGQDLLINADVFQFLGQALDFVVQRCVACLKRGFFIAEVTHLLPPFGRSIGQVHQRLELMLQSLEIGQARQRREQAVDRFQSNPELLPLRACFRVPRAGLFELLVQLGIFAGLSVDPVAFGFQIGQFGFQLAENALLGPWLVEFLGLCANLDKPLGQFAQSGTG